MTKRCYPSHDYIFQQHKYHINDKLIAKKTINTIFVSISQDQPKFKTKQETVLKTPNEQVQTQTVYKQLQLDRNGQLCEARNVHVKPFEALSSCTSCRNAKLSSTCGFCEKLICETCAQHCSRCSGNFCQLCSVISYEHHFESSICLTCM